ncbi:MAG: hypothetical protein JW892_00640, partial [Anaerolineae bacterium]|nr:hypothetical protein [Anaerolineae bacterium]
NILSIVCPIKSVQVSITPVGVFQLGNKNKTVIAKNVLSLSDFFAAGQSPRREKITFLCVPMGRMRFFTPILKRPRPAQGIDSDKFPVYD